MFFYNRKTTGLSFILLLALLAGMFSVAPVQLAYANTQIVTNAADAGPGSLRQAIADAATGDTITFDASLAGQTIRLASTLTIGKDLNIDGSNLSLHVQISGDTDGDGTADVNVFMINTGTTVQFNSLGILKGYSAVGALRAGGISNYGVLTLKNSTLSHNLGDLGGSIFNSGSLVVENSTFDDNTGVDGGAILNNINSTATVTGSTFSNNHGIVVGDLGGDSGAIANVGALTVADSVFLNNSAPIGGGAIANSFGGTATIRYSEFTGNSTNKDGGAINNFEGILNVENSIFNDDSARMGGAISSGSNNGSTQHSTTITNSIFYNNSVDGHGGAVMLYENGNALVTGSTFENNAASTGGGINNSADLTVTNSTFFGNSTDVGLGVIGGGISSAGGSLTLINDTFSANLGGAINNIGPLILKNTILANSINGLDCYNDPYGEPIIANISNLIESSNGCGDPLIVSDPALGPLADNGGSTQTMALLPGSPAIDAGDNASCPAIDQRGVSRPQGLHCDIGAFEALPIRFTISGNAGVSGAMLSYAENGTPKSVMADGQGNYSFTVPAGWSGTVTPSRPGVTFDPSSKNYADVQADQSAANYVATIVVSSVADGGAGSLRQAITDAAPGATIKFDPALAGQTITLDSTLAISKNLTVDGSGLSTRISISGNNAVRILNVGSGCIVVLQSLNLMNGKMIGVSYTDYGGAIYADTSSVITISDVSFNSNSAYKAGAIYVSSSARISVDNSSFTSNTSQTEAGVILVNGSAVSIRNSSFSNNSAGYGGGTIYLPSPGIYDLEGNTFSNNTASNGGAILIVQNSNAQITIRENLFTINAATNSYGAGGAIDIVYGGLNSTIIENNTFYANRSANVGGAIYSEGNTILRNNTFSENQADRAGGNNGASLYLESVGYTTKLYNNIFANNLGGGECSEFSSNIYVTGNNNLVEDGSPVCLPILTGDPLLGPLADNGGQTLTMALQPGSPAIDAGDDATCPAVDQRGVSRPQGPHCDIGAYESEITATASPTSVHIGDLDSITAWVRSKWVVTVTINVHDSNHNPVVNATVHGAWSGGSSGSTTCTTGTNGQCNVTLSKINFSKSDIVFTVKTVKAGELPYNASDNHDPDGDSNGTTITIPRPWAPFRN